MGRGYSKRLNSDLATTRFAPIRTISAFFPASLLIPKIKMEGQERRNSGVKVTPVKDDDRK